MIVDREKIDSQNGKPYSFNFYINDIGLPVDPLSMQIYKEGLSYSYKALRSKSSAKVVSGNGILHLSLRLVFDEESMLHLHRLVCQLKNSPYVQIRNQFVADSILENSKEDNFVEKKSSVDYSWFTLSSFQISPMPESPSGYVCELDLRYFNHKPYQNILTYKKEYTTIPDEKGEVYTFSMFDKFDNITSSKKVLYKTTKIKNGTKRKVDIFGDLIEKELIAESISVTYASSSDAYVRYSNFLQATSLKEDFGFEFDENGEEINDNNTVIKEALFTGDEIYSFYTYFRSLESKKGSEPCLGIHDERVRYDVRMHIIDKMVHRYEGMSASNVYVEYDEYEYLPFSSEVLKKFREKLLEEVRENDSIEDKKNKIKKAREALIYSEDDEILKIAEYINSNSLKPYANFPEYAFIYRKQNRIYLDNNSEETLQSNNESYPSLINRTIASFSGMFRNIISTIPIVGQEFPTHQFLGSIEPVYQMSILGKTDSLKAGGSSLVNREIEFARTILQRNSRNFKMVPDAGYFSLDNFITRLLGTYKEDDTGDDVIVKRLTLTSIETKTVEGSPGVDATTVRFGESKTYELEKIRPAYSSSKFTTTEEDAKAVVKQVKANVPPAPLKKRTNTYRSQKDWATKFIDSKKWYRKIKKRNADFDTYLSTNLALDTNSFNYCKTVVDKLGEYLSWDKNIFGKAIAFNVTSGFDIIGTPIPGRTTMSQHFVGGAADFKLTGIGGDDLLRVEAAVYFLWKQGYFKDNYFKGSNGGASDGIFVKAYCDSNNEFIHIDKRLKVSGEKAQFSGSGKNKKVTNNPYLDSDSLTNRGVCKGSKLFYYRNKNGENKKSFVQDEIESGKHTDVEGNINEFFTAFKLTTNSNNTTYDSTTEEQFEEDETSLDVGSLTPNEARLNRLLNKKNVFEEGAFGDKEVERETVRWSDLTKQQQKQIRESSKVTENELKKITYEVVVVSSDFNTSSISDFDYFKETKNKILSSYQQQQVIPQTQIIIPRSSRNINQNNINEDEKIIVKMLEGFPVFASAILTEPEFYKESYDVNKELASIKEELYGVEVRPFLYSNTIGNILGKEAFVDAVGWAQSLNTGLTLGVGITSAAGGGVLAVQGGVATGAALSGGASGLALTGPIGLLALGVLSLGYGFTYIASGESKRIAFNQQMHRLQFNFEHFNTKKNIKTILKSLKNNKEIQDVFENQPNILNNDDWLNIMESTIDSVEILRGAQSFLQYIILESPFLKTYNEYQKNLKTYTNVFAALGGFVTLDKAVMPFTEDKQKEAVLALNADMLFAGEIRQVFINAFDFPSEIYFKTDSGIRSTFKDDTYSKVVDKQHTDHSRDKISITLDGNRKERFVFNTNKKVLSQFNKGSDVNTFVDNFYNQRASSLIPFDAKTLEELNKRKIGYLKNLYKELVKAVKNSKNLKKIYGVKKKPYIEPLNKIDENCYPDILLPKSPAGENVLVNPSFYFYERGLNNAALQEKARKNIKAIIENSSKFCEDLQLGLYTENHDLIKLDETKNKYGIKSKIPLSSITTDIQEGASQTLNRTEDNQGAALDILKVDKKDTPLIPNSTVSIESANEIEEVKKKIKELTNVGRKAYDANRETEIEKVAKELKRLEDSGNITNLKNYLTGSKDTLQLTTDDLIAKAMDSYSTVLSTKDSIKRAFPTFKLYLIEEDVNESDKLLIFDDFYSYNSVIDFTIHKSRKLPADTATVRVQNISGILDGTKRHVIRDIDINGNVSPDYELAEQDKVQSIVLRPGINAQIRVGYDSNPNNLKIIFTGRITEVAQSGSGDTLELTLQSFGVELVAKKYGVSEADPMRSVNFTSTHQLLSTLALSQELRHFGRYKRGKKFLAGENQQGYLDTTEYLTESWLQLNASNWVSNFYTEYWKYIFAGAILWEALGAGGAKYIGLGNFTEAVSQGIKSGGAGLINVSSKSASGIASLLLGRVPNAITEGIKNSLSVVGTGLKAVGGKAKSIGRAIAPSLSYRSFYKRHIDAIEQALLETNSTLGFTKSLVEIPAGLIRDNRFLGLFNISPAVKRIFRIGPAETLTRDQLIAIVARAEGAGGLIKRGLLSPGNTLGGGVASAVFNANVLGFRVPSNISRVFLVSYLTGGLIDLFSSLLGVVRDGFDIFLSHNLNPTKTKFLLSPQDDNIFAPPGSKYISRYDQDWAEQLFARYLFNGIYDTLSYNQIPLYLLLKAGESGYEKYLEFLKHPAVLGNKMLSAKYKENIYNLSNTTIWEVFHEMYLRHPGWIYGVKQYGKGLEQRIFFGLPDQYYYAQPLDNETIDNLNEIFFKIIKKSEVSIEDLKNITGKEIGAKDKNNTIIQLKNYFIDKVKSYKKPYRQYHHITSENDIISNNLILRSESTYNSIAVQYSGRTKEGRVGAGMHVDSLRTINAHPFIPKDKMRQKNLVLPNIKGFGGAARYGVGALLDSAKEMYQGSILVLGDGNIEPWDVCILEDNYSIMHGPFEVEAVTHIFSYDTGFVTDIKPNALVTSNEAFNQPILDTAPIFIAQKKLLKDEVNFNLLRNGAGVIDVEKIKKYIEQSITTHLRQSDGAIDKILFNTSTLIKLNFPELQEKLTKVSGQTVSYRLKYETLVNVYSEIIKDQIENRQLISTGELTRGVDVSRYIQDLVEVGSLGLMGMGVGGAAWSAASTKLTASRAGLSISKTVRSPLLLGSLLGLGIAGTIFSKDLARLGNDKLLTGGLANSVFGDMLLARVNEANAIRVFPLSKDTKPLIASGYEGIPPQYRFKRVLGRYVNMVSDAAVSMTSRIKELEGIARDAGYKEFDNSVVGFTKKVAVTVFGGFLGIIGNENYAHIAAASLAEIVTGGKISESAAWAYLAQDEFSRVNNEQ